MKEINKYLKFQNLKLKKKRKTLFNKNYFYIQIKSIYRRKKSTTGSYENTSLLIDNVI